MTTGPMNDHELARYLGLSRHEFDLLASRNPLRLEYYRELAEVSSNLEQLPTKYNRPPDATLESEVYMNVLSARAFARLEAIATENEAFRQQRAEGSQRARNRRLMQSGGPGALRALLDDAIQISRRA